MEGMTGRLGRLITSVCMVLYCFGTTITLLIVIGHQFDRTFASFYGPNFSDKVCYTKIKNTNTIKRIQFH
jgi:amino acid permease